MATYKGYNTIGKIKNFKISDYELVKRDFLNSLNIRQGEVPGRPEVGTTIWNFVFEPNTEDTIRRLKAEIERLADNDPRLTIEEINIEAKAHTVLLELSVRIYPSVDLEILYVQFDERESLARYTALST
jgi:phage baseplate assembly protein W